MRNLLNSTPLLVFVAIIIALYFSLKPTPLKYESQLTSTELNLLNGEKLDLNKLRGQFYILHFFASWCEICKNDFVYLDEVKEQTHITIIGVAINDNISKLQILSNSLQPYDYIAIDTDLKLAKLVNSRVLPQTMLINPEGKIILNRLGGLSKKIVMDNIITAVLK